MGVAASRVLEPRSELQRYGVNAAVRHSLAEDAEDLAAFDARANEPNLDFKDVLKDLKRRGKL